MNATARSAAADAAAAGDGGGNGTFFARVIQSLGRCVPRSAYWLGRLWLIFVRYGSRFENSECLLTSHLHVLNFALTMYLQRKKSQSLIGEKTVR